MNPSDSPYNAKEANRLSADERIDLLETIREIVAQEVDRRLKGK